MSNLSQTEIHNLLNSAFILPSNITKEDYDKSIILGISITEQRPIAITKENLIKIFDYVQTQNSEILQNFSSGFIRQTICTYLLNSYGKKELVDSSELLEKFKKVKKVKQNILINLYNIDLGNQNSIVFPFFELHNPKTFIEKYPNPLLLSRINEENNVNPDNAQQAILILKKIEFYTEDENSIELIIEQKSSEFINFLSVALGNKTYAQALTTNFSHNSKQFHFLNDEYQIISSTISSSESSFLDNKIILFDNFTEQHRLLFDLLATTNNKLNEKLYKAVLWLGKSLQTKNLDDCFLQVAIALECLLSRTEKGYFIQPSITVNLAETLTFLIAKTKEDRIKIFKDLKNLYGKRSAIVHNGSATIDFETYNKFFIYVKSGIYSLLELVKQKGIKSIDDVYNYVETAKFS